MNANSQQKHGNHGTDPGAQPLQMLCICDHWYACTMYACTMQPQQASQVDGDINALPGGARLQRVDLGWHQPPQGAPRPGEGRDEDANEHDDADGDAVGQLSGTREVVACSIYMRWRVRCKPMSLLTSAIIVDICRP